MLYLSIYISRSGYCSRRNAIELIKSGQVQVNGLTVHNPATMINASDLVAVNGNIIALESFEYILFNKPTGCITTTSDEKGRKTVLDYVHTKVALFPVGRLDQDTTGLLILTNDGNLAQQLMHPKFQIEKEYHVTLDRPLEKIDFEKLKRGIRLPDGFLKPDNLTFLKSNDFTQLAITIHSGKKRIIRRFFGHIGYEVIALDRFGYAIFSKNNTALALGTYRYITKSELQKLHEYIKNRH